MIEPTSADIGRRVIHPAWQAPASPITGRRAGVLLALVNTWHVKVRFDGHPWEATASCSALEWE